MPEVDPLAGILAQLARERAGTLRGEEASLADAALQPSTGWPSAPSSLAAQVFRGPPVAPSWSAAPPPWPPPSPPRTQGARNPVTFTQAFLRALGVLPPVAGIVAPPPSVAARPPTPRTTARTFQTEPRREG